MAKIEMRIERLLKRDEIAGFEAFDRRPKTELPRVGVGESGLAAKVGALVADEATP
jgi:hypothetical protein